MIPVKLQEFIDKAVGILKQDPRITGIALTGSYTTGDMDEYSDLDFMVFIEPGHFERVLNERYAIVGRVGKLLSAFTGDHIGVPDLMICLYDAPLIHADFNFMPLDEAEKRIKNTAIVYDKHGYLSKASQVAEVFEMKLDPQWIEDRFWVWVHYTALKIVRGELFEAIDAITFIRSKVIGPMLHVINGKPPRGVRKLESVAPEFMDELIKTIPTYETAGCASALNGEIELYREVRESFSDEIIQRADAEMRAVAYLNEITGRVKDRRDYH